MGDTIRVSLLILTPQRTEERPFSGSSMTFGSNPSCGIVLEAKAGVAPVHGRIESDQNHLYVVAQSNSMVTNLNGSLLVAGRRQRLLNGDRIGIGTTTIQVRTWGGGVTLGQVKKASVWRRNGLFFVVVVCLTGIIVTIVLVTKRANCNEVQISLASSDTVIRAPVELKVTPLQKNCIKQIEYFVDTEKFNQRSGDYNIMVDPNDEKLAKLDHSSAHQIKLIIEDQQGRKVEKLVPQLVRFADARPVPAQENVPFVINSNSASPSPPALNTANGNINDSKSNQVSTYPETVARINNLVTFFSGEYDYVVDDSAFYEAVQRAAAELGPRYDGIWSRAKPNSERIRFEFSAQNLKPAFGYVLALSRSGFDEKQTGEGRGWWQLPPTKLKEEGFITGGAELTDSQRGPRVAAVYSRSIYGTFEHNLLLTIAFYDTSTATAGGLNADLVRRLNTSQRKNLQELKKAGVIKEQQLNNLVQFFAAAYVASYPWDFGLQTPSLNNIYN